MQKKNMAKKAISRNHFAKKLLLCKTKVFQWLKHFATAKCLLPKKQNVSGANKAFLCKTKKFEGQKNFSKKSILSLHKIASGTKPICLCKLVFSFEKLLLTKEISVFTEICFFSKNLFQSHKSKDNVAKGSFSLSLLFTMLFFLLFTYLFFLGLSNMQIKMDNSLVALYYSEISVTKNNEKGVGFAEINILERRVMANKIKDEIVITGLLAGYSIPRLIYDDGIKIKEAVFNG